MYEYLFLVVGIALLYYAGNYLVDGSSALAKKFGISSLVIGLTVVAFGTSAPELIVNMIAAFKGQSNVAFGNIIGSNMANILIILGLSACILPISVASSTVKKEIPFALFGAVLLMVLTLNIVVLGNPNELSRWDGAILLLGFGVFLAYIYKLIQDGKRAEKLKRDALALADTKKVRASASLKASKNAGKSTSKSSKKSKATQAQTFLELGIDIPTVEIKPLPNWKIWTYIVGGLLGLFIGGKLTVDSAVSIAQSIGISEFFISVTIVAVGTSLPELITSVIAAAKKEMDLSVGNIIGSNIFNIFFVMGLVSLFKPLPVLTPFFFDFVMLILVSALLWAFMYLGKRYEVERWQGITFLLLYVLYVIILFMNMKGA
jgi:cation:H+ antiporter